MAKTEDYKLGEFEFPRGWFMVAEATELDSGPVPLRFFGKDFALFRGESGKLICLDAFCRHMGAHLAGSKTASIAAHHEQIEGDAIRCPYHGWRYNSEGRVDDIPGFDGPCPKAATLGTHLVREVMGAVMMWHDPEGGEPDYEPPQLPEWDMPNWINGAYDHLGTLAIHPQEVLDNMADSNHLGPTHGVPCEYFENEFNGHVYQQRQGGFRREYDAYLKTLTWYTGPGLLLSRQSIGDIYGIEFIFHTPVDDGVIKVWHNNLLRVPNDNPGPDEIAAAKAMQGEVLDAFSQDFEIWSRKQPAIGIMGLPTERNFQLGRTWYRQFYNPRNRAAEFQGIAKGRHVPTHKKPADDITRDLEMANGH
ncbi:(2Fe-2S)-binding protein [Croceicoccus estronivorus]|uniref:Rieske 2Fe-2S domain-containing protein n=1 Tax=Croceicoccus estronivorus TaxID=1172626 RepID=UPI00083641AD|nr:Rieske 2Fe-2S domain-containing protein [Croceicoccus estronivorus]OCC25606.1 (2Fe-2S)-binding protein [Croceicoccus estronivorus]